MLEFPQSDSIELCNAVSALPCSVAQIAFFALKKPFKANISRNIGWLA